MMGRAPAFVERNDGSLPAGETVDDEYRDRNGFDILEDRAGCDKHQRNGACHNYREYNPVMYWFNHSPLRLRSMILKIIPLIPNE